MRWVVVDPAVPLIVQEGKSLATEHGKDCLNARIGRRIALAVAAAMSATHSASAREMSFKLRHLLSELSPPCLNMSEPRAEQGRLPVQACRNCEPRFGMGPPPGKFRTMAKPQYPDGGRLVSRAGRYSLPPGRSFRAWCLERGRTRLPGSSVQIPWNRESGEAMWSSTN